MSESRDWTEEIRIAGNKAAEKIKELVREGNVRRIVLKKANGDVIREIPLTQGLAVGGVLALLAPVLATLGAILALLAEVRIEIVRDGAEKSDSGESPEPPEGE